MFLSLGIVFFLVIKRNDSRILGCFLMAIGVFIICQRLVIYCNNIQEKEIKQFNKGDAGYYLLTQVHEDVLDDPIYVVDTDTNKKDDQIWYLYQYLNYDLRIIPVVPQIGESYLVFFNGSPEKLGLENFYYCQLDDNEYVACNSEDYKELLMEQGLLLEKY